ncbi:hypothetical protein J2X76_005136 [Neorhizobium sp. 2083]|uniref:hypothetical protein n=1 Tax=Neorhizobium sp. 2083 TaxID=2817762 RepID=UPI002858CEF2|nr:hypothetical protein [Neorhizobium sp. 2083]MDR6819939.1 hypothetical protein [Neorhizobium sp. 2083]
MVHPSEDGLNQAAMSESLHLPHPARLPAQRVPSPAPFRTFQIEQKLDLPRLSVCFHLKLWLVDGSNLIKTFGYRVLEAKDGPAASQISATGGAVDLIFTDVVSPRGMIGADVVAKAKEFGHR